MQLHQHTHSRARDELLQMQLNNEADKEIHSFPTEKTLWKNFREFSARHKLSSYENDKSDMSAFAFDVNTFV